MFPMTVYGITRKFPATPEGRILAAQWVANVKGTGRRQPKGGRK